MSASMDKPLPSLPLEGRLAAQARASGSSTDLASRKSIAQSSDKLPSQHELDEAFAIPVLDSDGNERLFGDLFNASNAPERRRVMVVFVRHFFCGSCQDYIQTLSSSIPSPASLPADTSIMVIGCGAISLIPMYAETTSCAFPIYTDPTGRLYSIFDMTHTWSLGPAPQYLKHSTLSLVAKGISQGLRRTFNGDALKSGNMAQVGGEFFFEAGSGNGEQSPHRGKPTVTWCHRMKTTRDHTEIPALKRIMGMD